VHIYSDHSCFLMFALFKEDFDEEIAEIST